MYKDILIPVDGSDCNEAAIIHGLELAKLHGAKVLFMYALDDISGSMWIGPESVPYGANLLADMEEIGREALAQAAARAKEKGVESKELLINGHPANLILEKSAECDLVVMATHGRRGLDRFLLGSVTDAVLRKCHKPILVIHS